MSWGHLTVVPYSGTVVLKVVVWWRKWMVLHNALWHKYCKCTVLCLRVRVGGGDVTGFKTFIPSLFLLKWNRKKIQRHLGIHGRGGICM